jgi:catechol 2,3-dioxygenase-like lactoylglutathione lyase family enzyme
MALNVKDMAACERFYVELLGLKGEWRPDVDNVYLTSGCDNLALHKVRDLSTPVSTWITSDLSCAPRRTWTRSLSF